MQEKNKQKSAMDVENLPQNPNFCMIVPNPDDLWDDTEKSIVSTGMS